MIDIEYSVDMVRLRTRIPDDFMKNFVEIKLDYEPSVKYWTNYNLEQYRHNWRIEQQNPYNGVYSYWLGYHHNSSKDKEKHDLVIEYNPNKCPIDGMLELILFKFYASKEIEVVSLDIAMDFEVNISYLLIDKFRKNKMKMITGGKGEDDITYYLGESDGRIKIYNKARELGIEGDLTRYEVSKKINEKIKDILSPTFQFKANIPPIGYLTSQPIDKTLEGLLWAVKSGYPITNLSRRHKEKVRQYIDENTELKFDDKKISQAISAYFQGYQEILKLS